MFYRRGLDWHDFCSSYVYTGSLRIVGKHSVHNRSRALWEGLREPSSSETAAGSSRTVFYHCEVSVMFRLRQLLVPILALVLLIPFAAAQSDVDCCGSSTAAQPSASATAWSTLLDSRSETYVTEGDGEKTSGQTLAAEAGNGPLNLIVDIGKQKLFLLKGNKVFKQYAVSTGVAAHPTPTGSFTITAIKRNAWWNPPNAAWAKGKKPIPPGPNNPMGPVKMQLSGSDIYIHGIPAKEEGKLGSKASHGCVRLASRNALEVASLVKVGTPVKIVPMSRY